MNIDQIIAFVSETGGLQREVLSARQAQGANCLICRKVMEAGDEYARLRFPFTFGELLTEEELRQRIIDHKYKRPRVYTSGLAHWRCLHKPRSIFDE